MSYNDYPTSINLSFTVDGISATPVTWTQPSNGWPCIRNAPTGAQLAGRTDSDPWTDEEVRAHLEAHPELLDDARVQEYLRAHPAADLRNSSRKESWAPTDAPAEAETTPPSPDDSEEAEVVPPSADTDAVTSSPNE